MFTVLLCTQCDLITDIRLLIKYELKCTILINFLNFLNCVMQHFVGWDINYQNVVEPLLVLALSVKSEVRVIVYCKIHKFLFIYIYNCFHQNRIKLNMRTFLTIWFYLKFSSLLSADLRCYSFLPFLILQHFFFHCITCQP